MNRCAIFSILVATVSCASQPICRPWSPTSPELATSTSDAPPPAPDDGTVALSGAGESDTWTSVVGEGPRVAAASDADKPTARPRKKKPAAPAKPVVAVTAKPAAAPTAKPTAAPTDPAPVAPKANRKGAEAKAFFAGRCVPCHGTSGQGDGPTGIALTPRPRNFTDRTWQKSVTDLHIEKVILQGGLSIGKSPLMPPHGDLAGDPELLSAMREVVRGFGR